MNVEPSNFLDHEFMLKSSKGVRLGHHFIVTIFYISDRLQVLDLFIDLNCMPTTKTTKTKSFTSDWFSSRIPLWTQILAPALAGKVNARALELGSYEGRSALWTIDNLLTGRNAHLTCVDDFRRIPGVSSSGLLTTKRLFLTNLASHLRDKKVRLLQGDAAEMLRYSRELSLKAARETYDLIYVDTSNNMRTLLEQAVLAFPLLKPRGFMVFDDYTHSREHDQACPRPGIDAFLTAYAPLLKVRHSGWQVIVQKRSRPLAEKICKSELFHEDLARI